MTLPSKPINLRLTHDLHERFMHLRKEFPQLTPAALLRLLIAAELHKPIEDQVTTIVEQLRTPTDKAGIKHHSGRHLKNSRNRVEER